LGKADPQMLNVFKRSSQYSDGVFHNQFFFPARSSVEAGTPPCVRKRWM
jgi:hypothetical protein